MEFRDYVAWFEAVILVVILIRNQISTYRVSRRVWALEQRLHREDFR